MAILAHRCQQAPSLKFKSHPVHPGGVFEVSLRGEAETPRKGLLFARGRDLDEW